MLHCEPVNPPLTLYTSRLIATNNQGQEWKKCAPLNTKEIFGGEDEKKVFCNGSISSKVHIFVVVCSINYDVDLSVVFCNNDSGMGEFSDTMQSMQ